MLKNKVCMIIPYFGKLPEWFNLYLYSCSKVNIDFYFFTDCKIPRRTYKNTFFYYFSYEEYCDLVSSKLNIKYHPADKYNLVKIKPFLGIIHKNICSKYLFWGFSDVDLIYGKSINSVLLKEENLNKYNLITTHSNRISGHFTIIRFLSKYTSICMKIPNWKAKLETEKNIAMDEEDFAIIVNPAIKYMYIFYSKILTKILNIKHSNPSSKIKVFEAFQVMQKIYRITTNYDCLFNECYTSLVPKKSQVWKYKTNDGNIICPRDYHCQDLIYLHFLFFKKSRYCKTGYEWGRKAYKISCKHKFNVNETIVITYKGIEIEDEKKIVNS